MEFTLKSFLIWVLSGGGASVITRWIVARIPSLMAKITEQERALLSGVITAFLLVGVFVAMVAMGYTTEPASVREWVEILSVYVLVAIGAPSIMSVFMRVNYAVKVRRGAYSSRDLVQPDMWLGVRW